MYVFSFFVFKRKTAYYMCICDWSSDVSSSYLIGDKAELSCVPLQQTPKNNFSVSARYLLPLDPSWGDVEGSVTYSWNDRKYTSTNTVPQAEPGSWLSAQGLLNGSLSWSKILGSDRKSTRLNSSH